jgi:hypothetical protein
MKRIFKKKFISRNISPNQLFKEIQALEPKNPIDFILKGSGINQWLKINLKQK